MMAIEQSTSEKNGSKDPLHPLFCGSLAYHKTPGIWLACVTFFGVKVLIITNHILIIFTSHGTFQSHEKLVNKKDCPSYGDWLKDLRNLLGWGKIFDVWNPCHTFLITIQHILIISTLTITKAIPIRLKLADRKGQGTSLIPPSSPDLETAQNPRNSIGLGKKQGSEEGAFASQHLHFVNTTGTDCTVC